jgi:hypothetical protein
VQGKSRHSAEGRECGRGKSIEPSGGKQNGVACGENGAGYVSGAGVVLDANDERRWFGGNFLGPCERSYFLIQQRSSFDSIATRLR